MTGPINKYAYALLKDRKTLGRLLPTLLDNRRVYRRGAKASCGPLAVVWDTNFACNAKCKFCNYWRMDGSAFAKELSEKQKLRIIKILANAGVCFLSICSGEPLMSGDLSILIREAKANHMIVNISTNGSLLFEKAELLIDAGVDFITVSIDSHNPQLHNRIRGYDGLFENIEKGIEKIMRLRKGKTPRIEARCLINRLNAYQLDEFVDYWSGKVDSIVFKPIYSCSANFFKVPDDMQFQKEDKEKFSIYYRDFLKRHKRLNSIYHREIPNFFFDKESLRKKYSCFAGTFFGHIDYEGNLYSCKELDGSCGGKVLGNLKEADFLDLWNSEKAKEARSFLKRKAKCDCWMDKFILNICLKKLLFVH